MANLDGVFITNTGIESIPVDALHFMATNKKLDLRPPIAAYVPPGSQREYAFQMYPRVSKITWTIAGRLDAVEIPYTAPSGLPIIPPDEC
jgi:hypothetical protein